MLRLVGFANNRCAVGPCAARPIDAISTGDPRRCAVVDWWLVNRYGPVEDGDSVKGRNQRFFPDKNDHKSK